MKRTNTVKTRSLFLLIILIVFLLFPGCAAEKHLYGNPETGLILEYYLQKNKALKYRTENTMVQTMEVIDQKMENTMSTNLVFTAKSKGQKQNNYQVGVTIDSAYIFVLTPQGDLSPDVRSLIGKSFDMSLSRLGKEEDFTGTESIVYTLQGNTRDISLEFQTLFPNLPGRLIKTGETWITKDTIKTKESGIEVLMTFDNIHTLSGFKTVDGFECVEVSTKSLGKIQGSGQQGGVNISFDGNLEGSEIWYFAYKDGVFVKTTSDGFGAATVTVTGPQAAIIPIGTVTKTRVSIIK